MSETVVQPPTPYVQLKCYSQILCGGSEKKIGFCYFVLSWWQTDKKTGNPEAELQKIVYLDSGQLFN